MIGKHTKQPPATAQIDWSNPIAKKLAFLWIGPHTGGDYGRDLVSGNVGVLVGTGDVPTRLISDKGQAVNQVYDGAAVQSLRFRGLRIPTLHAAAIIHRSTNTSNQTYRSPLTFCNVENSYVDTNVLLTFEVIGSVNQRVEAWLGASGTIFFSDISEADLSNTDWHTWYVEHERTGALQNGYLSVDGQPKVAGDNTQQAADVPSSEVNMLAPLGYPNEGMGADMVLAAGFTAPLSDAELNSFHKNPWQVVKTHSQVFALADSLPQTRALEVPQFWNRQPTAPTTIDRSNPITRDMLVAIPMSEGHGHPKDVVSNVRISNTLGGYAPVWTGRDGLKLLDSTATTQDSVFYADVPVTATGSDCTIVVVAAYGGAGGNATLCRLYELSSNQGWEVYFAQWDSNTVDVGLSENWGGGATKGLYDPGNNGRALTTYVITNGPENGCTTRANGAVVVSGGQRTTDVLANNPMRLELDGGTNIGGVALVMYWNRELLDAEVASITKNPWQVFKRDPLHVGIEYQELTFDSDTEERLFIIPQNITGPKT